MNPEQRITAFHHDGLEFEVLDTGPLTGDIVVLLHGWPQTADCWKEVSERLNSRGYRTIMPNQRGYSMHARPKGVFAYRMSLLVADIHELVRSINSGPVHLVGHDWGSSVAWSFSAKYPGLVRTLTSISVPHSGAFIRAMFSSDQLFRVYYMGLFQMPVLPGIIATRCRKLFRQMLGNTGMTTDDVDTVYRDVIDAGAFNTSLNWYRAMGLMSPLDLFGKVLVPVTHIWGTRDSALSRRSAELAGRFAKGPYHLHILEEGTHWLPAQMPDEISRLILEAIAAQP
ncbi:MAG: alpha/beta fold hydrolase [Fluviicoccus sp.]|uniref:alpha/beta fold hydrolase n=1 Tax=Fluviicoccus sp. TaxID=2003552 RepID=UPI0027226468|nr:alpha/beta fold hydrolase [Fluviicoccus sp.]MDO8330960.1 alpha/beta fold hydrolase [Fluviicoccus sp.]